MQAAHTVLPFPSSALQFAAVELTKGIIRWNLTDKLSPGPIPDIPKKFHEVTSAAFGCTFR